MINCEKANQRIARSNWILNESSDKVLLQLTLPMLPAIIALMALDLFDTYLASLFGTEALAALSFTIPVTASLFAIAIGLSIGVSSVLCHALGSGEHDKVKRVTSDGMIACCLIALIVTAIGCLTTDPLFDYLGVDYALIPESFHQGPKPDLMPVITEYMKFRYIGFVFMLIPLITNSIMRAIGDSQLAGRIMFSWALLTAIIDATLILKLNSSVSLVNIGIGHLLADILFSVISIYLLIRREKLLDFKHWRLVNFIANCRSVLKIGIPAAVTNLMLPVALAIVTGWVAFYGREAIAAFGVVQRIETLALFLPMALSTSLPVFVGQNYAAGLVERTREAIMRCFKWTLTIQLLVYLLLVLFADTLASVFSESVEVTTLLSNLLWFLPVSYIGLGVAILAVSSLNAMQHSKSAFYLGFLRVFIMFIPAAYVGTYFAGLYGLFIGMIVANIVLAVVAVGWIYQLFGSKRQNVVFAD